MLYAYCRVSSGKQLEGLSMSLQGDEALLSRIAKEYHTTVSDRIYIDEGVSSYKGKNLESGQLGEIVRDIEKGRIEKGDIIVMRALDRLSRQELTDSENLYNRIVGAGVNIYTTIDNHLYKPNCVHSAILKTLALNTAHEESAKKAYLTNRYALHRIEAFQRGEKPENGTAWDIGVGKHPFWIQLDNKVVQPHRLYFQAAKDIVKLIIDGKGNREIMRYLEENHPRYDKDGERIEWSYSLVASFHRKEALTGLRSVKLEDIEYKLEDYYPRVCTDLEFHQMSLRKEEKYVSNGNRARPTLLGGIRRLYCSCGRAMGGITPKDSPAFYRCLHILSPCISYISLRVVDRIVLDAIQTHVFESEKFDDTLLNELLSKADLMRIKYSKQESMLMSDPDLFTPEFKQQLRKSKLEIEQVEQEIMAERKKHAVIEDVDLKSYAEWQAAISEFQEQRDDEEIIKLRDKVQKLVRRIDIDGQLITITMVDGKKIYRHIVKDNTHDTVYCKVHVVDSETLEMVTLTNPALSDVYCLESELERFKSACNINQTFITRIAIREKTDHLGIVQQAVSDYLDEHDVLRWRRSDVMKLGVTTTQWQMFKEPEHMSGTGVVIEELKYKDKNYAKKSAVVAYKRYNEQAILNLLNARSLI